MTKPSEPEELPPGARSRSGRSREPDRGHPKPAAPPPGPAGPGGETEGLEQLAAALWDAYIAAVHGYDPVHKITPFSRAVTASQVGFRAVASTASTGATIAAAAAIQALAGERDRLAAQLREMTGTHATLLEEILRNAGQDIHDGDEPPEYLAEHYVRSIEGDLGRALEEVRELRHRGTGQDSEISERLDGLLAELPPAAWSISHDPAAGYKVCTIAIDWRLVPGQSPLTLVTEPPAAPPGLAELVQATSRLESYAASYHGPAITGFLLHLADIDRGLEALDQVTVANSPDVAWALKLRSAQVTAEEQVRTARVLLADRQRRELDSRSFARLTGALSEVRERLTAQYPGLAGTPTTQEGPPS
jgi:hypothetical protein